MRRTALPPSLPTHSLSSGTAVAAVTATDVPKMLRLRLSSEIKGLICNNLSTYYHWPQLAQTSDLITKAVAHYPAGGRECVFAERLGNTFNSRRDISVVSSNATLVVGLRGKSGHQIADVSKVHPWRYFSLNLSVGPTGSAIPRATVIKWAKKNNLIWVHDHISVSALNPLNSFTTLPCLSHIRQQHQLFQRIPVYLRSRDKTLQQA